MELSETQLASVDWVTSSTDAKEYNYSAEVVSALEKLLISVIEDRDTPNLDRFRMWFPIVNVMVEGSKSSIFSVKRRGLPLYCVIVTKESNEVTLNLNSLRHMCTLFPYQYITLSAAYPIYDNDVALTWVLSGDKNHYVYEYIHHTTTLDVFLREGDYDVTQYLSLYLQVILGMRLAQSECGLVHNKLTTNNIMVDDHLTTPMWLPVGTDYVKTDQLLRMSGLFNMTKGDVVIGDIYTFTATFLYNLRSKRTSSSSVRIIISILTELIVSLSVPIYLVSGIINLDITLTNVLHEKVRETSYDDLLHSLCMICDKRSIDYRSIWVKENSPSNSLDSVRVKDDNSLDSVRVKPSLPSNTLDLAKKYELTYSLDPSDGYLYLVAQDCDNEKTNLYIHYLNMSISNIKDNIESNMDVVSRRLYTIKQMPDMLMKLEYGDLLNSLDEYNELFNDFLLVRVLIDELRVKLRYRNTLVDDIVNSNISNYIKEKESKLLRTLGENDTIYSEMYKIVSPETMERIDNIWEILNNDNIRTR